MINKKGYTLIEVIISITILSLCMTLTMNIFVHTVKLMEIEKERAVFAEMVFILDFIEGMYDNETSVETNSSAINNKAFLVIGKNHFYFYPTEKRISSGGVSNRLSKNVSYANADIIRKDGIPFLKVWINSIEINGKKFCFEKEFDVSDKMGY